MSTKSRLFCYTMVSSRLMHYNYLSLIYPNNIDILSVSLYHNHGNMSTFKVIIVPDDQWWYTASIPALDYCVSRGATVDEALNNVQEAMEGVIETMIAHDIPLPQENRIIETSITYPSIRINSILQAA